MPKQGVEITEKMRHPLVSVIVPFFNYGQYISECLHSVIAQTYDNWECLVVDDWSTPDEYARLDDAVSAAIEADDSSEIRFSLWAHDTNLGYNAAKNTGILASKGEFIRLIDADDVLMPNALHDGLVNMLPEVDLVHGYADRWYGGNDFRGVNKKTFCHAQGRMWRRTVYDRFGLYYEPLRSMGDKEFIYRLGVHPDSPLPRLVKDYKLKKVVAHYRKHFLAMHKQRRLDPKKNAKLKKQFKRRIKQLKREGITRENTRFPQTQEV